jgi:hypothetical protein
MDYSRRGNVHELSPLPAAKECKCGAPGRNRTGDLPLRRGLLYPLSYRGFPGTHSHVSVKNALAAREAAIMPSFRRQKSSPVTT